MSRRTHRSLSEVLLRMAMRATWREARATANDGRARAWALVSRR